MDKSWIHIKNRLDPAYVQGVESFIEFAYANRLPEAKIYCPCKKCVNLKFETRTGVKEHIIINGYDTKYTRWTYHEELSASSSGSAMDVNHESDFMDDMVGLVHDAFGIPRQEDDATYMRDEDVPWVRPDMDGTTIDDVGVDCVDVDDSDEEDDEYYDDDSDDTYTDTDDDVDDDDPN
ncbi:hypothetical protein RHMOL_Rhmol08G0099000 [Rhododendron molle]|uniref:Uncharacterized protein n=1 Tax=Rhododendron molle TaxID=49168 RepID=A0ACC0MN80_RHOML|nr:hypothetical protein RHMOL_Rhmol08G0099000 [Rhododendron molle]